MQPDEVKWQLMIASCYRRSGNYHRALDTYKVRIINVSLKLYAMQNITSNGNVFLKTLDGFTFSLLFHTFEMYVIQISTKF